MAICRERLVNIPPPHDYKGKAVREAPVFVGTIGEEKELVRAQLLAVGNYFHSRIETDSLVAVSGSAARSGTRHSIHPLQHPRRW